MKLFLAPMEGVVDSITRDVLTGLGGIDQCTSEFIRITTQLLPEHVYYREAPELLANSKTPAGTPLFVQLLGGDPVCLAENAAFAACLGAAGIDLNFGCPAKTVNRNDGGATLLQFPDRIFKIVEAVRRAVPSETPVTAKIRLGFSDPNTCFANAAAAASGGAERLTVHCRTKLDMYKPPAYWEWIPKIKEVISIPVVANGEIWTVDDLRRCQEITGCDEFMIGRGALRDPLIFRRIKAAMGELEATGVDSPAVSREPELSELDRVKLLADFFDLSARAVSARFAQARTKQWLRSMSESDSEMSALFERVKVITQPDVFRAGLRVN